MEFWSYSLTAESLCLGERVKGGLFRPCNTHAIRYSALTGALRAYLGRQDVSAAGYFAERAEHNIVSYLTYAPRGDVSGVSLLPLTIQYLANAYGLVVIRAAEPLLETFELSMGAFKSKGLGRCRFERLGAADMTPVRGALRTRIPCDRIADLRIAQIVSPVYGYLFEPTSVTSGEYVLSLWEGSEVLGPQSLVEEER